MWYLASIAKELDALQRMQVAEERLVDADTIILLQVVK